MMNESTQMKKHLSSAALIGIFAIGLVTASFAQTTGEPGAGSGAATGAGSANGSASKPDSSGAKPSNSGTQSGNPGEGTTSPGGAAGLGRVGGDTSEDRVPHR